MTKNTKRRPPVLVYAAAALLLVAAGVVFILNKWETHIELIGPKHYHVQTGESFEDPGVIAETRGTLLPFLHRKLNYTTEGTVDGNANGTYTVRYVIDNEKDPVAAERIVTVSDTVAPVITLTEIEDHYTVPNHIYEEEGYTAVDSMDGDLTDLVQTKELNGYVYYSVTDSSGNTGIAIRKIFYDDRTPPGLVLEGGGEVTVWLGSDFEDSYTAVDDADGDVTSSVQVTGSVDTSTAGDYELSYTSTDAHGNTVTVYRTVHVKEKPVNNDTGVEGPKVIYLTFDDGPYRYTETLLDILDKYNVKATFSPRPPTLPMPIACDWKRSAVIPCAFIPVRMTTQSSIPAQTITGQTSITRITSSMNRPESMRPCSGSRAAVPIPYPAITVPAS